MSHCLNCGAEDPANPCEACGLTPREAEFVLRRKLLYQTAAFLLGSLAFLAGAGRYPPLEIDAILIFLGVLFFAVLGLAMVLDRRASRHLEVEALKRIFRGLLPLPWLLAVLLVGNGVLDRHPAHMVSSGVVGRFSIRGPLPIHRLVVRSWRTGQSFERIPVSVSDYDLLHPGDPVDILLRDGLIGIPWVDGISRHDDLPIRETMGTRH